MSSSPSTPLKAEVASPVAPKVGAPVYPWKLNRNLAIHSIFTKKPMREHANLKKVCGFLEAEMGISYLGNPKYEHQVIKYSTEADQVAAYKAAYNAKKKHFDTAYGLPAHKWGRIIPVNNLSLSIMRRSTRHAFCKGIYRDIDMVNAHPNILSQICRQHGRECPELDRYVSDPKGYRERIMKHHACDKDTAKRLPISLMMGGSIQGWITENQIEENGKNALPEMAALHLELQRIMTTIYEHNQHIKAAVLKVDPKKWENEAAAMRGVMGLWCQTIEREIQESCIQWLVDNRKVNQLDICPSQDGFMVLEAVWYDRLIEDLEAHCIDVMGFAIRWLNKPFDEADETIPDGHTGEGDKDNNPRVVVKSDRECSKIIFDRLKDTVKYCRGEFYMQQQGTNYWTNNMESLEAKLLLFIADSGIQVEIEMGSKTVYLPYAESNKAARAVMAFVMAEFRSEPEDEFYSNFHETTKGRIAFQDGVYDFAAARFFLWSQVDFEYYTCVRIPYNGSDVFASRNQVVIDEVKSTIFDNLFGDSCDLALRMFARSMAGHWEDKIWSSYMGNRNCGKGVLEKLFRSAFAGYVQSVDMANFVCVRATKCDQAKEKAWALCLEFARQSFAQENSDADAGCKYNGNIIKSICSGTDTHLARPLYKNIHEFNIQTSLMFLSNDEPNIVPADTWEKGIKYQSTVQFKDAAWIADQQANGASEVAMACFKPADPLLMEKCLTDEWKHACIHLLVDHYMTTTVSVPRYDCDESTSLRNKILEDFTIIRGSTEVVMSSVIDEWKRTAGVDCSMVKISAELKSLGCSPYRNKKGRGFMGLVRNAVLFDDGEASD